MLVTATLLVFTVLVVESRSFYEPLAIVFGAVLALLGTMLGLWIGDITLNIVSYLGAISPNARCGLLSAGATSSRASGHGRT